MFSLSSYLNQLPSFQITDYFSFLKAMRITTSQGELPCKITNADRQIQWNIPAQPVDFNTMITDTLIVAPFQININCFVLENVKDNFLNSIERGQKSADGFTLTLLNGSYSNLRLIGLSVMESSDISNGFLYSLDLKEIILAKPNIISIPAKVVNDKSFSSTENKGKQNASKSDSSILYKMPSFLGF